MSAVDESVQFEEEFARYRQLIAEAWEESAFKNSFDARNNFLNSLPPDVFQKSPNFGSPRTIRICFPIPSNVWPILGQEKMMEIQAKVPHIAMRTGNEDASIEDERERRILQLEGDMAQEFIDRSRLPETHRQFDDITVEVNDITGVDMEYDTGQTGNAIVKIDETYIGYLDIDFLKTHLPELVTLADSHKKVQQEQNHSLPKYILYNKKSHYLASHYAHRGFKLSYGDHYFKFSAQPPFYAEYVLLHELAHYRNGDTNPLSIQNRATAALEIYTGKKEDNKMSPVMGALYRAKNFPEDMAIRLFNVTPDLSDIRETLQKLDALYTNIKPAVTAAAKHMHEFYRFKSFGADRVAVDMQRKKRFLEHVLRMPAIETPYTSNFREIRKVHGILNSTEAGAVADTEADTVPNPDLAVIKDQSSFDSVKADIEAELQAFAANHEDLLDSFMILNSSTMRIRHAKELCADLGMVEMADHPENVPEVLAFFDILESATHPASEHRDEHAVSHVKFLDQVRGTNAAERIPL